MGDEDKGSLTSSKYRKKNDRNSNKSNQDKQDELIACEERYTTLFETMKHGVVYQDAEGNIISANPAAERILGLSFEQMVGRKSVDPRWRAVREDGTDFPSDEHPAMVALKSGKTVERVVMGIFNPKQNDYRWIHVSAIPLFNPGESRPYQVYTTFEDITTRSYIEQELREKEFAIKSSINAITFADTEGKVTYVNDAFLKMWRIEDAADVIGRSVVDFWKNKQEAQKALDEVLQGIGRIGELVAKRDDGTTFMVQISAGPIMTSDGSIKSIMASSIDITESKNAEMERNRQNREMELYASLLRHDIGNDLQILLAYIESLDTRYSQDQPENQENLKPIKASIYRMSKLLNALGKHSEIEERTLIQLLEGVAKTATEIHHGLKVNIQADKNVGDLHITGYRFLSTVFENLIRNTAQNILKIPIVDIQVSRENGNAIIDFVDNGNGIPDDLKPNLFQKGITTNGGGLGLYLTRQILRIYNGSIELMDSREGEGARFRIMLPLGAS